MLISGKELADDLHKQLRTRLGELKKNGKAPQFAIVTDGSNISAPYIRQKIKLADKLGIQHYVVSLEGNDIDQIYEVVQKLQEDKAISGIVVQRPLPPHIDTEKLNQITSPEKDIDAFRSDSIHQPPLWQACLYILEHILKQNHEQRSHLEQGETLNNWLKSKQIVILGKGESGGKGIIDTLNTNHIPHQVIDSKTQNPKDILTQADLIISCVGKKIIDAQSIKKGVILIGIGIYRASDNKLYGDYDENEIKDIASYYTPTPGGVGPLNLAFLFKNLLATTN